MTHKDYKLIILDRDGVINVDAEGYISDPNKWHPFPGSLEAIAQLNAAEKLVGVVSNQSGIGRGLITETQLATVHQKMQESLAQHNGFVDKIVYCPHHPNEHCACRKPKTLLLEQLQSHFQVPKEAILIIGDSACDINAGLNFGCDAHLVLTGHGKKTQNEHPEFSNIPTHADLCTAINVILGNTL